MKITSIRQQVINAGRYSVFVDDKYSFSLSEASLLETKLANGQEITAKELDKFKSVGQLDKIYDQTLKFLAIRPRSKWEIVSYLKRKKLNEQNSEEILNKLSDLNLIDDASFANMWVQNRRLLKTTSKRKLAQELRQKHIDNEIVNKVMGNDEVNDQEMIKRIIQKKSQQSKYKDKLKLMQYLSRQGFNYDDIKTVIEEYGTTQH